MLTIKQSSYNGIRCQTQQKERWTWRERSVRIFWRVERLQKFTKICQIQKKLSWIAWNRKPLILLILRLKEIIWIKWFFLFKTWQKSKRRPFFKSYRDRKINYMRIMISMKRMFNFNFNLVGSVTNEDIVVIWLFCNQSIFWQHQCTNSLQNNKERDWLSWKQSNDDIVMTLSWRNKMSLMLNSPKSVTLDDIFDFVVSE